MGSGKSGRVVGAVLAATFVLVICGAGVEAGAQTRKRAPQKKATAAVWTRTDCGGDVAVFLSAPGATQGGLLQTELRSPTPLSDVSGTWDEKPIPFWQETPSATSATKAPSKRRPRQNPNPRRKIFAARCSVSISKSPQEPTTSPSAPKPRTPPPSAAKPQSW